MDPLDTNGDGYTDAWGVDNDGDGRNELLVADQNSDGIIDTYVYDTNQNGYGESVYMDTDQDGTPETAVFVDLNENGTDDRGDYGFSAPGSAVGPHFPDTEIASNGDGPYFAGAGADIVSDGDHHITNTHTTPPGHEYGTKEDYYNYNLPGN
jgi:hypothetical protein